MYIASAVNPILIDFSIYLILVLAYIQLFVPIISLMSKKLFEFTREREKRAHII